MEISSVIQSPSLVEIVNSTSSSSSVKKINEVDFRFDSKNLSKDLSSEYKSAVVTENYDNYSDPAFYNYQLQTNSPASRINTNIKLFNETNKTKNYEITSSKDDDSGCDYSYEQTEELNSTNSGSGYYFVFNDPINNRESNLLKNFKTEFQKRINKTYHLDNFREPGTLVNLVF